MKHATSLAAGLMLMLSPMAFAVDTDGDGYDDNSDNCTLVANPDQRDTDEDGFGNRCDGDFDNDLQINAVDLGVLRANFFSAFPDTDLDGDGITNTVDLGIFKAAFFGVPGPTSSTPDVNPCDCYFSGDCNDGFCDWGPSGFTVEDVCFWRTPKPNGLPGMGCDTEYEGAWGPICDGVCTSATVGSLIGRESVELIVTGIEHWKNALVVPSAAGGGAVDSAEVAAVQALPFVGADAALELGRHVADLLSMASEFGFYDYFCHYEHYPNQPGEFVDIQNDTCRIQSAELSVAALKAELQAPGSGAAHIAQVASYCAPAVWQSLFAPRCAPGPDALSCFAGVVADLGVFLSTPRAAAPGSEEALLDALNAKRQ